jgi:hypothetical protein
MYARFLFWRKTLCLSPIPGVASHMHESTMTPHIDWERWVEQYVIDLKRMMLMGKR